MKQGTRRILAYLVCVALLLSNVFGAYAEETVLLAEDSELLMEEDVLVDDSFSETDQGEQLIFWDEEELYDPGESEDLVEEELILWEGASLEDNSDDGSDPETAEPEENDEFVLSEEVLLEESTDDVSQEEGLVEASGNDEMVPENEEELVLAEDVFLDENTMEGAIPFAQTIEADGVAIHVNADAGVFATDAVLNAEQVADDAFAARTENVLGIQTGDNTVVRHQMFRFDPQPMNGAAQIEFEGLDFAAVREQYPNGNLSAYVTADLADASDAAVLYADINIEDGKAVIWVSELTQYDVVTVVTLPVLAEEPTETVVDDVPEQTEETLPEFESVEDSEMDQILQGEPVEADDGNELENPEVTEEAEIDSIEQSAETVPEASQEGEESAVEEYVSEYGDDAAADETLNETDSSETVDEEPTFILDEEENQPAAVADDLEDSAPVENIPSEDTGADYEEPVYEDGTVEDDAFIESTADADAQVDEETANVSSDEYAVEQPVEAGAEISGNEGIEETGTGYEAAPAEENAEEASEQTEVTGEEPAVENVVGIDQDNTPGEENAENAFEETVEDAEPASDGNESEQAAEAEASGNEESESEVAETEDTEDVAESAESEEKEETEEASGETAEEQAAEADASENEESESEAAETEDTEEATESAESEEKEEAEEASGEAAEEQAAESDASENEESESEAAETEDTEEATESAESEQKEEAEEASGEAAEEQAAEADASENEESESEAAEAEGAEEETESAESEQEDGTEEADFAQKYVRVNAGTVVYQDLAQDVQSGFFAEDAVVYAVASFMADDNGQLLQIVFDMSEARENDEDLLIGYINQNDTADLEDAELEALKEQLSADANTRSYEDSLIPAASFVKANLIARDGASIPVVEASADREVALENEVVTFTVAVNGTAGTLKYQWQRSTDGTTWGRTSLSGYNTDTLSFEATEGRLACEYRCRVTDDNGNWYSNAVKVDLTEAVNEPVITASADREVAPVGATVTYSVTAEGTTGTLQYLWQRSSDGTTWERTSLTGYKTDTLSFVATEARLSYQYRCKVTDDNGTWYSNGVKVNSEPEIVASADKETVSAGELVTFTVQTSGTTGDLTYQWQRSTDGTTWERTSLNGYKTDTLSFEATEARLVEYRCKVTDANGTWYSNAVKVNLAEEVQEPVITASANCETAPAGATVTFTVTAEGTTGTLQYQWQRSTDGTTWGRTSLSGYNTDTLSFEATESRLVEYRCRVIDANGTWYSNVVKVDLAEEVQEPVITASANCETAPAGATVTFTVTAEGTTGTLQYQWQRSTDGTTWGRTSLSGYNTDTLSFEATESRLVEYRCRVIDANGTWYSNAVKVDLAEAVNEPVITASADRETAPVGATVTYSVTAEGTTGTLQYLWQRSSDGTTWERTSLTGYKTDTLSFEATEARLSYQYRCKVTDDNGTWYSNGVKVNCEAEIVASADKEMARTGELVTFTVQTSGTTGDLTYQWQRSTDGTTWERTSLSGYKTDTLSFEATEARLACEYRCKVTDANGTWYSNSVKVELNSEIVADEVVYEGVTDTTCRVKAYHGSAASLVIPEVVEGMTVVEIGAEAFMGNENLQSIDLPDTISLIGARAFMNCVNLSSMN